MQQPGRPCIQLGFWLHPILLPKLGSSRCLRCLRVPLQIVNLSRLVNISTPAVRAQHGKIWRQTRCAQNRNFARTRRTAHATVGLARVGLERFPGRCHGCLLSRYEDWIGSRSEEPFMLAPHACSDNGERLRTSAVPSRRNQRLTSLMVDDFITCNSGNMRWRRPLRRFTRRGRSIRSCLADDLLSRPRP